MLFTLLLSIADPVPGDPHPELHHLQVFASDRDQRPLWLPAFWGGAFGTFLLRQYFLTIPRDLVDAARVDGASLIQIFLADLYAAR